MIDFIRPGKASVLIDGQFGSTGKGLAAAYQSQISKFGDWANCLCVTNAAPNAGHTTVLPNGRKFVTYHMPTIGVLQPKTTIYLNAGAIIDFDMLRDELHDLGISGNRVVIHPNAAVITDEDKEYERNAASGATKIASTQKGVGRALARKIMREGKTAKDIADRLMFELRIMVQRIDLNEVMRVGWAVVVETPQGMSLSLNNGFHPHCTSREVSVAQSLSDAGVHPYYLNKTLVCLRTYPIRVGNIVDAEGNTVGYSGGVYADQKELSWNDFPGIEPERTTVTKRVRRIFTFSENQYREAAGRLRPDIVHLGFCDYLKSPDELHEIVQKMRRGNNFHGLSPQTLCSFGPSTSDICSLDEAYARIERRAAS